MDPSAMVVTFLASLIVGFVGQVAWAVSKELKSGKKPPSTIKEWYQLVLRALWSLVHETKKTQPAPYAMRVKAKFEELTEASHEVDRLIREMDQVSQERLTAIAKLEADFKSNSKRFEDLKAAIEVLEREGENLPATKYWDSRVAERDRASARRDYTLFAAGVIVSAVVGVLLKVFVGI